MDLHKDWRVYVTKRQIGFYKEASVTMPAFVKLRDEWVDCYGWEAKARLVGISDELISFAKTRRSEVVQ
jgi:hypothetical protein